MDARTRRLIYPPGILTDLDLLSDHVGVIVLSAGVGNDVVGWVSVLLFRVSLPPEHLLRIDSSRSCRRPHKCFLGPHRSLDSPCSHSFCSIHVVPRPLGLCLARQTHWFPGEWQPYAVHDDSDSTCHFDIGILHGCDRSALV